MVNAGKTLGKAAQVPKPRRRHLSVEQISGKRQQKPSSEFSQEIWDTIYKYDIGRLLFVMRVASQLEKLDMVASVPKPRFTVRRLALNSDIHFIKLGGRTYVHTKSFGSNRHPHSRLDDIRFARVDMETSYHPIATSSEN